jgi:hypothetical protein
MSRNTQIIVHIPAAFNDDIRDYRDWLFKHGIERSKSDVILQLAQIGYRNMSEEMKSSEIEEKR